jgi:hypothetical protein
MLDDSNNELYELFRNHVLEVKNNSTHLLTYDFISGMISKSIRNLDLKAPNKTDSMMFKAHLCSTFGLNTIDAMKIESITRGKVKYRVEIFHDFS